MIGYSAVIPHPGLMTSLTNVQPGVHYTVNTAPMTPLQESLLPTVTHALSLHPSPSWAAHLGSGSVFIDGHLVDTNSVIHPSALVNPPTLLDGNSYNSVTMSSIAPNCTLPNQAMNMHYSVSTKPLTYQRPCPGLPMHQFILQGHVQENIGSGVTGLGCFTPSNTSGHKINLTVAEGNACGVVQKTIHEVVGNPSSSRRRRKHYHHSLWFLDHSGPHPYSVPWLRYHHYYGSGGAEDDLKGGDAVVKGGSAQKGGGQQIDFYTTEYDVINVNLS